MTLATEKKKISAYLPEELKRKAEKLAQVQGMSLSTLISFVLSEAVRKAENEGVISDD